MRSDYFCDDNDWIPVGSRVDICWYRGARAGADPDGAMLVAALEPEAKMWLRPSGDPKRDLLALGMERRQIGCGGGRV